MIGAPVAKALLGKAVIPDDHPNSIGGIGLLGTDPTVDAMNEADTLLMIGTSFPYIDYLPKPGQARGIQIHIIPEKIDYVTLLRLDWSGIQSVYFRH